MRCWFPIGVLAAWLLFEPGPALANGCGENPQAEGIGLAELETKYAKELTESDAAKLLADAKRLHESETRGGQHAMEENRVLALLLLQRILDGDYPERTRADAVILASRIRRIIAVAHKPPHYKCYELKALDEYVVAQGDAYRFTELWGTYLYDAQSFLDLHGRNLSRQENLRVRFEVYKELDPCDPYRADNGCYGPFFSELAEEAAGTPLHRDVMQFAFEANLNLAACPQATPEERKIGEAAARRWAKELGGAAKPLLARFDEGSFQAKALSDMCRTFGDM